MKIKIKLKDSIYINFEIDEIDLHFVIGQCCRAAKRSNGYYLYNLEAKGYVHRLIMNASKDLIVDHIDNNPQNLKRENLRLCTYLENSRNKTKQLGCSSKYKGVSYYIKLNKYRAYINYNNKRIHLGYFKTEQEAALAYNNKAIELFKEFANLNKLA